MPSAYTMKLPKITEETPNEYALWETFKEAWHFTRIAGDEGDEIVMLGSKDLDAVWALRDFAQGRRQAERDASWAVRVKVVRQ